jgi:hypothetical protein
MEEVVSRGVESRSNFGSSGANQALILCLRQMLTESAF